MAMSPEVRELKKVLATITSNVKNTVAQCIQAGKLLTEIKSDAKHGDWKLNLETLGLPHRTADRYMLLWEHRAELDLKEVKTLGDAYELIANFNSKSATVPILTSQNEALTHEKTEKLKTANPSKNGPCSEFSNRPVDTSVYLSGNRQEKQPDVQRDKIGRPIPEGILELWNQAHEIGTKLRSMVSDVKCALTDGVGKKPVFGELTNAVISEAEALHYSLSQIIPHAVCPKCQGKTVGKCGICHNRGFVSKLYWKGPSVDNELRNLIQKQYASQTVST